MLRNGKISEYFPKLAHKFGSIFFRKDLASKSSGGCTVSCKQRKLIRVKPKKRPIYLDAQATTPVDPRVLDRMLPYLINKFGNPHSSSHFHGWEAEDAVEIARVQVANLIGAEPGEICFTSGATEANNLSLKGCLRFHRKEKDHLITVATEHKCILETAIALQKEGFQLTVLPVQENGLIELKKLEEAITPKTALVSVTAVNNEIGICQPIAEIAALCESKKVFFHTDAAQATGKIPLDVRKDKISMMSISGHKLYGPKGIGALFVSKTPQVNLLPLINGGNQEDGLRSGTLPTPLVVGFGAACEIAQREMCNDHKWISYLSNRFLKQIKKGLTHVHRNGCTDTDAYSYPGCINLSFRCVGVGSLLMGLKDISLSTGSACTSESVESSYVLRALGLPDEAARSAVRFGIGRFTTVEEVDYTAEKCIEQVKKLREMSPLWEMVQEGVDLKTIIWAQH